MSLMATTCLSSISISSTRRIKSCELWQSKSHIFRRMPKLTTQKNSKHLGTNRKLSVCAEYSDGDRDGSSDFLAGFLLGGAVFGTVAYIFAPQIRRSILNEDESGFRRAKRPMYYDEGLEKTRETLNSKINQLNSAIDNVSSRLRGGNNSPTVPIEIETDPEVETTF